MFSAKKLLLLTIIFISIISTAQVKLCLDVISAKRGNGAGQGVFDFNNKWTPGATITVSFLEGSEWQKSKVEQYAPLWSQYANVKFKFIDHGTGDDRVSLDPSNCSYSYIGLDIR